MELNITKEKAPTTAKKKLCEKLKFEKRGGQIHNDSLYAVHKKFINKLLLRACA